MSLEELEAPTDMDDTGEGLCKQYIYWNPNSTFFCISESAAMDDSEHCRMARYPLYWLAPDVIREHWDQAIQIIDSYRGLYSNHFGIHIQLLVVSQIILESTSNFWLYLRFSTTTPALVLGPNQ